MSLSAADPAPRPAAAPVRQLSLFGAEAADPAVGDLAGLLAGPGRITRMGGTARISVPVADAWRVHVLVAELARRALPAAWEPGYTVRTAYTSVLTPLAAAWLRAGMQTPPARLHLDGRRLRLWVAAAGRPDEGGYLLGLDPGAPHSWPLVGAALAAAGLPATLTAPAAPATLTAPAEPPAESGPPVAFAPLTAPAAPAYRISGRRRLARLAELTGEAPPAVPAGIWPGN